MNVRKVETVLSVEQAEGVGARVRRSIGRKEVRSTTNNLIELSKFSLKMLNCYFVIILYIFLLQLRNLDPFLMLDEFKVSKPAGFPDHPHRGFETVRSHSIASFGNCAI